MHLQPSVVGKSEASIVLFTEQYWWCNVLLSEPAGAHSQRNSTSRLFLATGFRRPCSCNDTNREAVR
jgi:hypothetical protein